MTESGTRSGFHGTQVRIDHGRAHLAVHRLIVEVVEGPDRGLELDLAQAALLIGSADDSDLVLRDPTVSRRHCEIRATDRGYVLRDLGSTNGTVIGGAAVTEAILSPGAELRIGDDIVVFHPRRSWLALDESRADRWGRLVGGSPPMRALYGLLDRVAQTELSCLVVGETGTGKELVARSLHDASARAAKPFIVLDCAAVSATLVEAELFGHEKGAFTGADRMRAGLFEHANGGTIFLDEIGELPIELQPKLLRVLEQREVRRVGAALPIDVDVRFIAATHRDLDSGSFRDDLFYRIAEVVVDLPPLRERIADVPLLAAHFLEDAVHTGSKVRRIDDSAMQWLMARAWPGNVRELRNVVRRALALTANDTLRASDLDAIIVKGHGRAIGRATTASSAPPSPPAAPLPELPLKDAREQWVAPLERSYLERLLERCKGDVGRAAAEAGLHRKSLLRLMRRYGLKAR